MLVETQISNLLLRFIGDFPRDIPRPNEVLNISAELLTEILDFVNYSPPPVVPCNESPPPPFKERTEQLSIYQFVPFLTISPLLQRGGGDNNKIRRMLKFSHT